MVRLDVGKRRQAKSAGPVGEQWIVGSFGSGHAPYLEAE
jgi:hypothetical protein